MEGQFFTRSGEITGTSPISVLVRDEYDLGGVSKADPTSIAYTIGFAKIWQLNGMHQWIDTDDGSNTATEPIAGLGVVGAMKI